MHKYVNRRKKPAADETPDWVAIPFLVMVIVILVWWVQVIGV